MNIWNYNRSAGTWRFSGEPSITLDGCYAGNGVYRNDPTADGVKGHGPLPAGFYAIGALEPTHPHLGVDVFRLIPDAATRAHIIALGRDPDSFYCHGVNPARPLESSDGCICAPHDVRMKLVASPVRSVQVA